MPLAREIELGRAIVRVVVAYRLERHRALRPLFPAEGVQRFGETLAKTALGVAGVSVRP